MAACCYSIVAIIVTNSIVHSAYPYQIFPNHRYYGIPPKHEKQLDYFNKYKDHSFHTGMFHLGGHRLKTDKRLEEQPRYNKKTIQIGNRPEISSKESLFNHLRHETETQNKNKSFDNFVTTKDDILPEKRYEVTTENTEAENQCLSAVGVDNDVAIALDDAEEEEEDPEEINTVDPQEYFDSYGRLHQNQGRSHHRHPDGSYSYGVVHTQPNHYHRHSWRPTGRVRMKVFHGPTHSAGHQRYAQWGYYVVQPSEHQSNNHHEY